MRARDADGLHVASMRVARKRMMDSLSNAIERFESKYDWDSFNGAFWHFRWAKDWQIYHWRDFEEFYGEHCDYEWSHAQELLSSDEAFIIPDFLLRTVKDDLLKLARERMEVLVSHAIERVRTQYPAGSYDEQLWHFRWGRDCRIYHWRDFEDFYGENSSYEWYHATELWVSDEEFVIPEFLLHAVAKDF